MPDRKHIFYDLTISLCSKCLKRLQAKIVFENNKVYMLKKCQEQKKKKVLIATDIDYYKRSRHFLKPGSLPKKFNTKTIYDCPYDCGLCPDHEQHSCLTIVEVTDRCNLTCPTCYAGSSPTYGRHRNLTEIKNQLDAVVANEGEPDVVQISGGEPTIHPNFFDILDEAKKRPIKHLMLNTNGVKLASDREFVKKLANYQPGFEIYLQFDSFKKQALKKIRGSDLSKVREKALKHLNEFNLSTTLVVTLQKGINDDEIGEIINFATKQKCIRGVTFQPIQLAGRKDGVEEEKERITLTEVRQSIIDQSNIFKSEDLIPVPCNPDALVMGYALKTRNKITPLTRYIDPEQLLSSNGNTIVYEHNEKIKKEIIELFSTSHSPKSATERLHSLLCCLPKIKAPKLKYDNLFRIIIMHFMDAHNFDVRAAKRSCVHIVNKDNKIIPFETMNLFYRDGLSEKLEKLRNT